MEFSYRQSINGSLSYNAYRQGLNDSLTHLPEDEAARKMQPYIKKNVALMNEYDLTYQVSDNLKAILAAAPATIWLVLTEGWCGDAAFNVPMLAAIEKAVPDKVQLGILLRDSNMELMDMHLTDGGRSIPKLIVLSNDLKELGTWGPRPAGLQTLMKDWKSAGLELKEIIPKVHEWYNADATRSVQEEVMTLVKSYS